MTLDTILVAAIDAASVQAWVWDLATERVRWSPGLEQLLGFAPGAFGGTFDDYLAVIPAEERDGVKTAIQRALEAGASYEVEHRVIGPDGRARWVMCRGSVMRGEGGAPVGMAGMVWDVTSRRAAEDERRIAVEAQRFQAAILDQVNEAVLATDIEANIIYWNKAAERLYGWSAAEVLGKNGTDLMKTVWPNPADVEGHAHALRTVGSWRGEMIHATKSGKAITVEASIRILCDDAGVPRAGISVMQDVTAKRRFEEQLRQSQKMEAVGVLAGGVAHDFNNLLAVIVGFAEMPLRRLPADHPDAAALREVIAAAQRGAELTRKLLAFSRKQIIRRAALDLNAAIADTAKLLVRIVGEDVELVVERGDAPLVVQADTVQIEQIVFNLCTNARQAMPRGGRLAITTRAIDADEAFVAKNPWARRGRFAEVAVKDDGVGMDAATVARCFEPFFTTRETGTGLGLSTVYGIVEQHGGVVHLESAPGEGTTVRVHLPLDARHDQPARESPTDAIVPRGTETILVAEDSAPLRALVTSTLRELGYRVIAAEDGEQAVRAFTENAAAIGLVVLDVVMPKLGALEAHERMRAIEPKVKALFTTGYAPETTRLAERLNAPGVRVLEKPFTSRALGLAVRRAIDA